MGQEGVFVNPCDQDLNRNSEEDFEDVFDLPDHECLKALDSAESKLIPPKENGNLPVLAKHYIDYDAIKTWVYPMLYKEREYQSSMIENALFKNTLICLPTGLGKTFIAAVIMLNFSRWFPDSIVIFVSPTRSLVSQQFESCARVMKVSTSFVTELTGKVPTYARAKIWRQNKAFFLTPQVFLNDINSGIFDPKLVSLVVFDEAHHAMGDSYYCKIVNKMKDLGCRFRIVGLSATPGSDTSIVEEIVKNMYIENIDLRNEESYDIKPYVFEREIEEVIVEETDKIKEHKKTLRDIMEPYLKDLQSFGLLKNKTVNNLSRYYLIKYQEFYFQRNKKVSKSKSYVKIKPPEIKINCESNYNIRGLLYSLMSLVHAADMLEGYGISSCLKVLEKFGTINNAAYNREKAPAGLSKDRRLCKLISQMKEDLSEEDCALHPKTIKACSIVKEFFENSDMKGNEKVIVFTQFRKSVEELYANMIKISPPVFPAMFTGQSNGIRQKDQLKILNDFKDGAYNVIISTSVGEEGLDIGEVDLVIFYDIHASLVRNIQRMGRTSRSRSGKVILLMSNKKDQDAYKKSLTKYTSIQNYVKKRQDNDPVVNSNPCCLRIPDSIPTPFCVKIDPNDSENFSNDEGSPGNYTPKSNNVDHSEEYPTKIGAIHQQTQDFTTPSKHCPSIPSPETDSSTIKATSPIDYTKSSPIKPISDCSAISASSSFSRNYSPDVLSQNITEFPELSVMEKALVLNAQMPPLKRKRVEASNSSYKSKPGANISALFQSTEKDIIKRFTSPNTSVSRGTELIAHRSANFDDFETGDKIYQPFSDNNGDLFEGTRYSSAYNGESLLSVHNSPEANICGSSMSQEKLSSEHSKIGFIQCHNSSPNVCAGSSNNPLVENRHMSYNYNEFLSKEGGNSSLKLKLIN